MTAPPQPRHRKRLRRRERGHEPRSVTFSCYRRIQLLGTARLRGVFPEAGGTDSAGGGTT